LQATVTVKAAAAPTATPKPSPSATATPATSGAVKASASLSKRVISIYVANVGTAPIIAMIDSRVVQIGKNTVSPGKRTVRVYSGGKLILSRTFAVK